MWVTGEISNSQSSSRISKAGSVAMPEPTLKYVAPRGSVAAPKCRSAALARSEYGERRVTGSCGELTKPRTRTVYS